MKEKITNTENWIYQNIYHRILTYIKACTHIFSNYWNILSFSNGNIRSLLYTRYLQQNRVKTTPAEAQSPPILRRIQLGKLTLPQSMQAFTFEFYVLSLLIISKYHASATDLEVGKLSDAVTHEQTTEPDDAVGDKEDKQTTEKVILRGKISPLEHCILCCSKMIIFWHLFIVLFFFIFFRRM